MCHHKIGVTFAISPTPSGAAPALSRPVELAPTPTRICTMRIATWNVNSLKQRIDNLAAWLAERQPDIVCLQETKCVDGAFPRAQLEALGYNLAIHGQKTFNGVAILSKSRFDEVTPGLPGD